jgi:GrpB-like predicted nucleotidyltransferase (UPF0157 family)
VRVHGCPAGSPVWRASLLRRDWLRDDGAARAAYARMTVLSAAEGEPSWRRWERLAVTRAEDWAASSGWTPSLHGMRGREAT